MRLPRLQIQSEVRVRLECGDTGVDLTEESLKSILDEARWRQGDMTFHDDSKGTGYRRKTLDGFIYRFLGKPIERSEFYAFNPAEFQSWRDDPTNKD
jgi:hypothetical protein